MGDSELPSDQGDGFQKNAASNAEGGMGPGSEAGTDNGPREAVNGSASANGAGTEPPNNLTDQSDAVAEKEEPELTYRQRLDKRREELGLPPIPRVPDRSDELEEGDTMLHSGITRFVIRRANNIAIKYGNETILVEAEAMQFAKDAGIPAPGIISFGKREDDGHSYIEMDYIEGDTLEKVWGDLNDETRLSIAHQLRDILVLMRSLPPPANFIGGFELTELRDYRHYDIFVRPSCRNEEEFNSFLTEERQIPAPLKRSFRQRMGNSHKIVFSHCDLAPRNIMVRDNRIVALIDWEAAGWYPEYWEYVKFMHMGGRDGGWQAFVDEVFTETYDDELLMYTGLLWYQDRFDSRRRVKWDDNAKAYKPCTEVEGNGEGEVKKEKEGEENVETAKEKEAEL